MHDMADSVDIVVVKPGDKPVASRLNTYRGTVIGEYQKYDHLQAVPLSSLWKGQDE